MTRRRGLGRGLDALIPGGDALERSGGGIVEIPVESIRANPRQPRRDFDQEDLDGLAQSIEQHGLLQPVIVTEGESEGEYTLIAGERRLQAARQAGLEAVPALLREVDDKTRLVLALIENLQRTDLNPLEAAEGYRQLAEDFDLSHEQIAEFVGKSRSAVSNTLRLLNLPEELQIALESGEIQEGHARALLGLPDSRTQIQTLRSVVSRELSVRQTEELVRRLKAGAGVPKERPKRPPEETDLEKRIREALGTRVHLRRSEKGGTLTIHFYSDEELNAIVDQLLSGS